MKHLIYLIPTMALVLLLGQTAAGLLNYADAETKAIGFFNTISAAPVKPLPGEVTVIRVTVLLADTMTPATT